MELTEQQKKAIAIVVLIFGLALIGWLSYFLLGVAIAIFIKIAPWVIIGAGVMYGIYKYQESKNG